MELFGFVQYRRIIIGGYNRIRSMTCLLVFFFFFAALKYIAKNEFLKNKKSRIARTSNKNTAHARPNTKKKKKPFVYLGLAVEKISTPVREHNELGIVFRPRQFPILKKQKNAHKRNYT